MAKKLLKILFIGALALFGFWGYSYFKRNHLFSSGLQQKQEVKVEKDFSLQDLFNPYLADGFDFPFGDGDGGGTYISRLNGTEYKGWYVATHFAEEYSLGIHPGEDWNGNGGGNTDLGQPVFSTAKGEVIFAGECPSPWGNVVLIRHRFIENGIPKVVLSQYSHLQEIFVKAGERVNRRQKIGSIGQGNHKEYSAHLHFEIRKEVMNEEVPDYWPSSHHKDVPWVKAHYEHPTDFIKQHRSLTIPRQSSQAVIAIKHEYRLYFLEEGKLIKTYEIALGQNPLGRKEKEGDLKVPEGEYRICEKKRGPFKGRWFDAYLGPRWIRITYPNIHDALLGLQEKRISKETYDKIIDATNAKQTPPQKTELGGGIGIHGWVAQDWNNSGNRDLTWGCLSMHNSDLVEFFDRVEIGTPIFILP